MPVQGGWSEWTKTVNCTSPCVDGIEKFERQCNNPVPKFGGESCVGNSSKTEPCGSRACGKICDSVWYMDNANCQYYNVYAFEAMHV